ncbi:hypothetical protein ACIQNU_02350 [Streptomyces sp. NPDC091292]|uniref:hypothetical protein n=1 Tax=Streptomyces sp. NPDC091292 TaxID=3365991 RepID=UPI0038109254
MPVQLAKVRLTPGGGSVYLDGQRVPAVQSVRTHVEGGLVILTLEIRAAEVEMVQRDAGEGVPGAAP